MKKVLYILILLAANIASVKAGWWAEEGNGNIVKKEKNVGYFTKVNLKTIGNVYVKQGTDTYLRIDTDENIQKYVKVKIEDNKLIIYSDKSVKPTKLNIFITLTKCEKLEIEGSGNIEFVGKLKTNDLELEIDGSGDIELEEVYANDILVELDGSGDISLKKVKANDVVIELAGSGDIKFIGEGNNVNVEIMGSGDIDMDSFKVENFYAEISGSGDISIYVTKSLEAEVFGSGDILYEGNPKIIKLDSFGSGTIRKK